MAELIFVDETMREISREVKGRGRPPRGSIKQDDGNFIVPPSKKVERKPVYYIDVDGKGNVVNKEPKGRGRPKPGYKKVSEGEFEGNWVKDIGQVLVEV